MTEWEQVSRIRYQRRRGNGNWISVWRRDNDWAVTLTQRQVTFIDLLRLPVTLEGFGSFDEARSAANARYFPQAGVG